MEKKLRFNVIINDPTNEKEKHTQCTIQMIGHDKDCVTAEANLMFGTTNVISIDEGEEVFTSDSLQQVINARAEKRLKADIVALASVIGQSSLLRSNDGLLRVIFKHGNIGHDNPMDLSQLISAGDYHFNNWGVMAKSIFNQNIVAYVKEETEAFVRKVDELIDEVDDLKSSINY